MAAFIQMGISMGIIASDYYFYKGDKPLFLFGFNNPNRLGYALFQINIYIFLYLSLAGRRIAALLLFLAGSIVFYNISLSRTGIVASFAVVLFSLLLYSKFSKRIVRYLLKFFPLAAFVTTYYLSINYAKYPLLNMITSRRLELYHRYISGFKISNFFAGYMYHYTLPMDSGYLYMLFTSGAIGLLYYFTLFWKAVTQKTLNAVYAIIIAVSLYALMESIFPNNSVFCVFYYILLYKASRNEIKEFRSKSWMAVQIT
jgi:hypothetical protein